MRNDKNVRKNFYDFARTARKSLRGLFYLKVCIANFLFNAFFISLQNALNFFLSLKQQKKIY